MTSTEELSRAYHRHATIYGRERNVRFDVFRDHVIRTSVASLPRARVLDLESGPGHEAAELAGLGCDVTALDASGGMLEQCHRRGISTVKGDIRQAIDLGFAPFVVESIDISPRPSFAVLARTAGPHQQETP
jgi:SAM-dependent methyltransferase